MARATWVRTWLERVLVAKEILDPTEVGGAFPEMRSEAVPEGRAVTSLSVSPMRGFPILP